MFNIEITESAKKDLRFLNKFEQKIILTAIAEKLTLEPATPVKNRKQLRPNELSKWELRIEEYRVFYDIDPDAKIVKIKAAGWKEHNKLLIRGKEFKL